MNRTSIFRILLFVVSAYHIVLGLVGMLLPSEVQSGVFVLFFGASPEMTPDLSLTVRFAASYVMMFGLLAGCIAWKPEKFTPAVPVVLGLFGLRILNRLVVFGSMSDLYGISIGRNAVGLILLMVLFLGILLTRPRSRE